MLGFEQLERMLERSAKSGNEGYPPFNIEQTSESSYRITLAVAGFSEQDLSITVEDRQLVIRGRQTDDSDNRVFLHRGIAARQFQRSFVLADGVGGAADVAATNSSTPASSALVPIAAGERNASHSDVQTFEIQAPELSVEKTTHEYKRK